MGARDALGGGVLMFVGGGGGGGGVVHGVTARLWWCCRRRGRVGGEDRLGSRCARVWRRHSRVGNVGVLDDSCRPSRRTKGGTNGGYASEAFQRSPVLNITISTPFLTIPVVYPSMVPDRSPLLLVHTYKQPLTPQSPYDAQSFHNQSDPTGLVWGSVKRPQH